MIESRSILAQREFLLKSKPVVILTGDEFSKKEGITLTQQVTDYYNSIGGIAISPTAVLIRLIYQPLTKELHPNPLLIKETLQMY